ncbi:glycosyltransferase family 9 protein [Vibrio spartinae]|uniref:Lipopolysaccharide core heptosyltransferase RfaQ n=1 Tax=Vibrio spartinae TaxID=1918945 RepID=A0A1N6M2Q7_9VIBR|nr:glycosyltransferase family 9 protein [Vibrio spartinae]SIO93733.1 Lipopolysaccharide core heptosyltransferase RfaQ [Vibrio spartinae]
MALFDSAPRSICILRLSAIGDVCNAVAAVQAIQHQWPETKITWITGRLEAQLLAGLDNINLIVFDKKQGWQAYRQLWAALKGERFDALLHMQYAFRASVATLGIKATYKLGFDATRSQDCQTWFTNQHVPSPDKPHVLDGLLAFAQYIGIRDITPKWTLTYSHHDQQWATQQLSQDKRNLVIVPGASKAYKNWTAAGYAEVMRYIHEHEHEHEQGWHIILAGSPAQVELDLANQILGLVDFPVTNLVGHSTLKQMLALLDHSDLVIAPDTGPTHMANAMGTPVIGLYAHHNPQRTGPYCYQNYVVSAYEEAIQAETGKTIAALNWRARVKDKSAMCRIQATQVIQMFEKAVKDFHL